MQDNELYNYFREHKDTLNEMPGKNLWTKIESGLNNPPASAPKLASLKTILIATSAVLGITIGGMFIYNNLTESDIPPHKVISPLPVVNNESSTAAPFLMSEQADSVKKNKKVKPVVSSMKFRPVADTVKTQRQAFKSRGLATKDSLLVHQPITTTYGNTIKITTNTVLTKTEFDSLVARKHRLYAQETGKILLIKAKGYKPYRRIIQAPAFSLEIDTIGFKSGTMNFSTTADSIIYQIDRIYNGDQVTTQPVYPGGITAFYKLLKDNVPAPKTPTKDVRAYIIYVIEKDGSLSNITLAGDNISLTDEAAANILKQAQKWNAARLKGKPVRYRYALPLNFKAKK